MSQRKRKGRRKKGEWVEVPIPPEFQALAEQVLVEPKSPNSKTIGEALAIYAYLSQYVSDAERGVLIRPKRDLGYADTNSFIASTIIDPAGSPLLPGSEGHDLLVRDLSFVSDELLRFLHRNPAHFFEIEPRKFEEVIAELLFRQGYQVTLTPESKDGGVDLFLAKQDSLGSFLYVVECKRYKRGRPVGVEVIRQLYGVVEEARATAGILATTSVFTSGAQEWQRGLQHRLSLRDFVGIQEWLRQALMPIQPEPPNQRLHRTAGSAVCR